jgi:hypothetical protein
MEYLNPNNLPAIKTSSLPRFSIEVHHSVQAHPVQFVTSNSPPSEKASYFEEYNTFSQTNSAFETPTRRTDYIAMTDKAPKQVEITASPDFVRAKV